MIAGTVNARREAMVALRLRGPTGIELEVDALLDSGFSGSLTLSNAKVSTLGLNKNSETESLLADGTAVRYELYSAEVQWDGGWRSILVSALGKESLLGMRLLANHVVRFEVVSGGCVQIVPFP